MSAPRPNRVALVTLGCTRNEVDSEELAGRLAAAGWDLVADAADADVAVVNTCGFIEAAKKDSIDALLEASDLKGHGRTQAVVAVGCLAERYGAQLSAELPEADAVLGFDAYADLSAHLRSVLAGARPESHLPRDRRQLLPLTPTRRPAATATVAVPGLGQGLGQGGGVEPVEGPVGGPPILRSRLDDRPWAPLKIASGCDRRCAFCAIPMFRGAFVSRDPDEVVREARWLAEQGVREVFLVSENSTSYGKDLGDLAALEKLLPRLAAVDGLEWIRVSYLQPAEIRPGLLEAMVGTDKVLPWFDVSFQHASAGLLRRMRRFGGTEDFLGLIARIRDLAPAAAIRSNVIVGFPGETEADVQELADFLAEAMLDVVGVFGYSDEDGTEGVGLGGHLEDEAIAERVTRIGDLAEALTAERAARRIGEDVLVLVEEHDGDLGVAVGRCALQGPEIDGETRLALEPGEPVGAFVPARIVASDGVDLEAIRR
ncbi:MAG: 30S ribosomal protein S12 methylthiotransferase RimO [Tetrasphaera sp.]|jgi:ribosomal protein S12 methylthiotransferase|nr:30S ribosomal protein S12 methylthiotransferase RimO [Tetrasphaera sp.]